MKAYYNQLFAIYRQPLKAITCCKCVDQSGMTLWMCCYTNTFITTEMELLASSFH